MNHPRNFVVSLSLVVLGLATVTEPIYGKERRKSPAKSSPTPTPAPAAKNAAAYLRVWKAQWAGDGSWNLRLQSGSAKTPALEMTLDPKKVSFSEYLEVPSGAAKIALAEAEIKEGGKPLTIAGTFAPESFSTLLIKQKDGGPVMEIIDDAPTGVDPQDAELTVRNFAPDLTEIRVHAGDILNARLRAPDGYLHVRGIERGVLLIEATTRNAAGKETKWTNEADFRTYRKVTLLVFTDKYGRVRPRLVLDGTLPSKAQPEEAGQAEQ